MEAQDRFLRLAAAEAINPETGKVNPDRLRKFMQKNEILMNRFPTVKADLDNAIKTTREASRLELLAKGQNRNMEDNKAFSKILKADGVAVAQQALLSNDMESEIQKLVSVVKRGTTGSGTANGVKVTLDLDPGAATAGLRSAIYTAAINASTGILTFITPPNFEAPGDVGADNIYDVVVRVSDGSLTDTQAIAVTLTDTNEAPVLTSNGGGATASISIAENGTGVTTVTAISLQIVSGFAAAFKTKNFLSAPSINAAVGLLLLSLAAYLVLCAIRSVRNAPPLTQEF